MREQVRPQLVWLPDGFGGGEHAHVYCATDYDALHAEAEALRGLTPELPPRPPEGAGLPRYGLRWNGPAQPLSVPMDDGYWTPWHLAEALRAENAALRESSQDVRSLVEALEECAASLAWNCLGECRAIHAGPIMPAAMALDTARAALSTHRQAQPQ